MQQHIPWSKMTERQREYHRAARKQNYVRHHERNKTRMRNRARDRRLEIFDAAGIVPKCQRCGYDKCVAALDFHHRDPSTKLFAVRAGKHTMAERVAEAHKCDVLCANCHRETHASDENRVSKSKTVYNFPQKRPPSLFNE
jgi:hypothetical protein